MKRTGQGFRRGLAVTLAVMLSLLPSMATAGSLSVTGGAPGNFSATLTGSTQTVYAALGSYQASDTTGTGAGWNITIQASRFTCSTGMGRCPAGGSSLPLNSLRMAPPTVACALGTLCVLTSAPPTITIAQNVALDTGSASGVKVASAAVNTGEGTYNFTPGTVDGTPSHNLALTVPSSAYATTYSSAITISIGNGP